MNPFANGAHVPAAPNHLGTPARMIVLGYYDGPTEGVIQFTNGTVYQFSMPDEDEQHCRQRLPRVYALNPLPPDALDRLESVLAEQLTPQRPAWYVNWEFATPEVEREMDERVAAILAEVGPAAWLVTMATDWQLEDFRPARVVALQPA